MARIMDEIAVGVFQAVRAVREYELTAALRNAVLAAKSDEQKKKQALEIARLAWSRYNELNNLTSRMFGIRETQEEFSGSESG